MFLHEHYLYLNIPNNCKCCYYFWKTNQFFAWIIITHHIHKQSEREKIEEYLFEHYIYCTDFIVWNIWSTYRTKFSMFYHLNEIFLLQWWLLVGWWDVLTGVSSLSLYKWLRVPSRRPAIMTTSASALALNSRDNVGQCFPILQHNNYSFFLSCFYVV